MDTILEPRKNSLLCRIALFILLLGFTPFAVVGMHEEGKDYGIVFYVTILIIIVPDLYVKLFLKPISAVLKENAIALKYYHGTSRQVFLKDIKGYGLTEEKIKYKNKSGLLVYLNNGKPIDFTEINIKNVAPLKIYLDLKKVPFYGTEKLRPWYAQNYKYDSH